MIRKKKIEYRKFKVLVHLYGAPEFKSYRRNLDLGKIIKSNTPEQNKFEIISDFKWCMKCGGEVEFEWNGKICIITYRTYGISISEANKQETKKYVKT
ncbi:MAG: hypothetical protein RUMPE_01285 [Eubacteriales bacterium SKADARSKE-1]|nr:hypothetical protein [Eubacteriales bacterium SKADARSKE-1]